MLIERRALLAFKRHSVKQRLPYAIVLVLDTVSLTLLP